MPSESHPETPLETQEKFYLTTPIYYVNARPHIGHAYSTIVADVLARRHRLLGHDTFFLTGTDEHGQKIERSAAAAGIPPQQFADQVSQTFSDLWQRMGITHNDFIRTTDPRHKQGVQKLFQTLYDQGHIYLSTYTGQYSIGEEMFVEGPPGTIGPDGRPTETVTEENFFFRLSAFQQPLLDLIESDTLKITPESSKNEVLSFLYGDVSEVLQPWMNAGATANYFGSFLPAIEEEAVKQGMLVRTGRGRMYVPGALKDLSISRSSFTWGIPVPEAVQQHAGATQPHIIYVWLDALANYMTAIGYGSEAEADQQHFKKYWPANLHVVGKEITRFHCVYWPAFLLALNPALSRPTAPPQDHVILNEVKDPLISLEAPTLPKEAHEVWAAKWLPKAVTANGWLLFENSKMSKSKGNVVRTETILEAFGNLCPPVHIASPDKSELNSPQEPTSPQELASSQKLSSPQDPASLKGTASAVPHPDTKTAASAAEVRPPTKHEQDLFAADILRYYLLREIPFGQDGSFSFESMITRYNADLANGYGNLVSRTLNMLIQYNGGSVLIEDRNDWDEKGWLDYAFSKSPGLTAWSDPNEAFDPKSLSLYGMFQTIEHATRTRELIAGKYGDVGFQAQLAEIALTVSMTDGFITTTAPWKLLKQENSQDWLQDVLYTAAESIRIVTALLHPFLPHATAKVWHQLGLGDIETAAANGDLKNLQWGGLKPGTKLGPLSPIFPRADKSLITLMEDLEAANNPPKEKTMPEPTPDTSQQPAAPTTHPAAESLKNQGLPEPYALRPKPSSSDPAAPPRTSTLEIDNPGAHVAASAALTTEREGTPPHTEAQASGIFAGHPDTPQIGIDDFTKIDLRVAKILVAERIPKADKLLRLEVDLGYEQRQILSGIAEHYTPEELIGRKIVIIANLAPRKMRGLESRGMLLAASEGESGKPILATFAEDIAIGTRLR